MPGLETPISVISGIGPKRLASFEKMNLKTIGDILFHFPRKYLDRHQIKKISECMPGETVSLRGEILASDEKRIRRLLITKFAFSDGTGIVYLTFFNQRYTMKNLPSGSKVFVYGKIKEFDGKLNIQNPLYEIINAGRKVDYVLPVYPLVSGITQNYLRKCMHYALANLQEFPGDVLPLANRMEMGLSNMKFALANIHFPASQINLEKARKHLIFDEFFKLQLNLVYQKKMLHEKHTNISITGEISFSLIEEFEKKLPFSLTREQKKVLREIIGDFREGKILNRLLQGEVGSGKTVIAVFLLEFWAKRGFQAVFLAPTEILAEQHFLNWQSFFLRQGIETELLVGSLPQALKKQTAKKIGEGQISVLFGTHALLNDNISYPGLKMLVIDEQHKFGVDQRDTLSDTMKKIHCLAMSATPIPRSMALTLYGTVDISSIGQLPQGPRNVTTFLFRETEIEKVYSFIRERIADGKQGYFVAPSIEEDSGYSSVKAHYSSLKEFLKGYSVGILHGRLSARRKSPF